jgi:hypothetical protein
MTRINSAVQTLLTIAIVVIAYWNIWNSVRDAAGLPARASDEMVVQDERYRGIRDALVALGYGRGPIRYITNRDLKSESQNDQDAIRRAEAQYLMIPWTVLRGRQAASGKILNVDAPYLIGDFWDGMPAQLPPDLVPVHDSGAGLILFRKKSAP